MPRRFQEIDALRGAAVVIMIIFHFLFDYNYFISHAVDLDQGLWFVLGRAAAVIFVSLAGLSLTLFSHRKKDVYGKNVEWRTMVRRGIFIFSLGLVISLATFIFSPVNAVWFGVLHLIGFSLILGVPFRNHGTAALVVGGAITAAGVLLSTAYASAMPFWPILLPVSFNTFDYFPLFPWFGIFLLGIAAGHFFYPRGVPHSKLGWENAHESVRALAWLGRKSLLIYFLHQPILLGIIFLIRVLG